MQRYLSPLLALTLALTAACSTESVSTGQQQTTEKLGRVVMPLTINGSDGRIYRLNGGLRALYLPDGQPSILTQEITLGAQQGSSFSLALRQGLYQFNLGSWHLDRVDGSGNVLEDVTGRTTLTSLNPVNVNVVSDQFTSVTFTFVVDGVIVHFDPCAADPNAPACATGDRDGDGIANAVECSNPAACEDTDGDGNPDLMDTDSDNDGVLDGADPALRDACVPNAYATSCVPGNNGTADINVTITEVCDAGGADTCSFGGDAGTAPPAPAAPLPPDDSVNPGQLVAFSTTTAPNINIGYLQTNPVAIVHGGPVLANQWLNYSVNQVGQLGDVLFMENVPGAEEASAFRVYQQVWNTDPGVAAGRTVKFLATTADTKQVYVVIEVRRITAGNYPGELLARKYVLVTLN